ncbi:hypothetical protein AWZ03_001681 [Drosophila navojoa]|uniref:Uncharacterized protein n=1 Tax=Drosophila navojoa TaxID=7232 RepID=A0A484BW57_DRONA|nr:hypothetical protein AWZ03_001681 [Drosophila navojoa]
MGIGIVNGDVVPVTAAAAAHFYLLSGPNPPPQPQPGSPNHSAPQHLPPTRGVSFESCDTHFLCSDAPEPEPEPEPESQHDRALELELARILKPELNELAQHMVEPALTLAGESEMSLATCSDFRLHLKRLSD